MFPGCMSLWRCEFVCLVLEFLAENKYGRDDVIRPFLSFILLSPRVSVLIVIGVGWPQSVAPNTYSCIIANSTMF